MTESRVGAEASPPSSSSPSSPFPGTRPGSLPDPIPGSDSGSDSGSTPGSVPGWGPDISADPVLDTGEVVAALLARIAGAAADLHAFVAEPDRAGRLRDEVAALARRWPVPDGRPALFGVAVGVKDVFHADGLPTRGGSQLPADALTG